MNEEVLKKYFSNNIVGTSQTSLYKSMYLSEVCLYYEVLVLCFLSAFLMKLSGV